MLNRKFKTVSTWQNSKINQVRVRTKPFENYLLSLATNYSYIKEYISNNISSFQFQIILLHFIMYHLHFRYSNTTSENPTVKILDQTNPVLYII